jgi:tRNA(adenine34) deaminase
MFASIVCCLFAVSTYLRCIDTLFGCSSEKKLSTVRLPRVPRSAFIPGFSGRMRSVDEAAYMQRALELARRAGEAGEVPVGAVVVRDGVILGEGQNAQIGRIDPTAHAEINALRAAARAVANYRLTGAALYVTLEPCSMCCGAMVHARIEELVFAAPEPRAGAVVSARQLLDEPDFNHRVRWRQSRQHAAESGELLRAFFRARR